MPTGLSNQLKAELFKQESGDPYLTLVTLFHQSFTVRLVNNTSDILSNGFTYTAFPMKLRLPADDGETAREFAIEFDNASLDLIGYLRSVTGDISVRIEMILASMPDVIQMSYEDLKLRNVTYNATKIAASIGMDDFLSIEMTSERYGPDNFPGLF